MFVDPLPEEITSPVRGGMFRFFETMPLLLPLASRRLLKPTEG